MAAPADTKPIPDSGAESPTTARPLDLDDDDVQEAGIIGDDGTQTVTSTGTTAPTASTLNKPLPATVEDDSVPPAKPQRPQSEAQKNEVTLKEAFPGVDVGVIRAVLSASGGRVEPAFNALLEMTDPDAVKNEPAETAAPPPQPPRPTGQRAQMSQLEADELYARQLAEHYDNVGAYEARTSSRSAASRPRQRPQQGQGYQDDEREHSFLDDDLPVIRDNLRKGFMETQKQVNGWITNIKKKIEENFDESEHDGPSDQGQQRPQHGQYARQGPGRRSGDYHSYDADPQVLSDDFAGMKFTPDGTPVQRQSPGFHRPPKTSSPAPGSGRRVGFKEETEEINMYDTSPRVPPKDTPPASTIKTSKWQPLSNMEPSPIGDNDPFSLGDSEDEKDTTKEKPKDVPTDEAERLKAAAAEAMSDSLVDSKGEDATKKK